MQKSYSTSVCSGKTYVQDLLGDTYSMYGDEKDGGVLSCHVRR